MFKELLAGAFFKQTTGYVLSILRTSADKPRLYHIVVKLDPNLSDFDQVRLAEFGL